MSRETKPPPIPIDDEMAELIVAMAETDDEDFHPKKEEPKKEVVNPTN